MADSQSFQKLSDTAVLNAYRRNAEIEAMLKADEKRNRSIIKLLLLGSSESGKSTFAKQLKYEFKIFSIIDQILNASEGSMIILEIVSQGQTDQSQTDQSRTGQVRIG